MALTDPASITQKAFSFIQVNNTACIRLQRIFGDGRRRNSSADLFYFFLQRKKIPLIISNSWYKGQQSRSRLTNRGRWFASHKLLQLSPAARICRWMPLTLNSCFGARFFFWRRWHDTRMKRKPMSCSHERKIPIATVAWELNWNTI